MEMEANEPQYRKDVAKQRMFLKELFNAGQYKKCISRFENQPQVHTSSDRDELKANRLLLETYIAALIMDGKSNQVVDKIAPLINRSTLNSSPSNLAQALKESEPIPHIMTTNPQQWQSAIDRNQPLSQFSSAQGGLPRNVEDTPIKVILSESWSWSKFIRTFATRILYGILLMTGLSVVLDQQGILKSGITHQLFISN